VSIITVIPARIGSRGIQEKNLALLGSRNLLQHAIDVARQLNYPIFVTTDSDKVAAFCHAEGDVNVLFAFPPTCHGDHSTAMDVWRDAWKQAEAFMRTNYELSFYLEPTSPMRDATLCENALDKMCAGDYDLVMSVERVPKKYHPAKQYTILVDLVESGPWNPDVRRQDLGETFVKNGGVYVGRRHHIMHGEMLTGEGLIGHIVTERLINIDTMEDLQEARTCFTSESTPA
jgi:CMP-N,N'-diacetyllegionaminic acid synthase